MGTGDQHKRVPNSVAAPVTALWAIPAFAVYFRLRTMYWAAHHRDGHRFGFDHYSTRGLSLLIVFIVLIYILPLRGLLSIGLYSIRAGMLPTNIYLDHLACLAIAVIVYAIGILALSWMIMALNRRAQRAEATLGPDARKRTEARLEIHGLTINASLAALSLQGAGWVLRHPVVDGFWPGQPGFVCGVLARVHALFDACAKRLRRKFDTPA